MNPQKIKVILNWEAPTNQTEVRNFFGLTRYYRRFIENFSIIASLMTKLLKKNVKFEWSDKVKRVWIN